jgi:hypothetical protein
METKDLPYFHHNRTAKLNLKEFRPTFIICTSLQIFRTNNAIEKWHVLPHYTPHRQPWGPQTIKHKKANGLTKVTIKRVRETRVGMEKQ